MKFFLPNNIFAAMFRNLIQQNPGNEIQFREASVLSSELEKGNADLALIPSCDLIKHPDFFVSGRTAISFDGLLSNAFFYFIPGQNKFSDLYLKGDISMNEIILSKILFKERYSSEVQIHLETMESDPGKKNYLIVGDSNFTNGRFNQGLSLSDELSTLLFLPYVNFVLASKEQGPVERFNAVFSELIHEREDDSDYLLKGLDLQENSIAYLKENLNSVYYEVTDTEMEGLKELLLLPYYHGITDEMVELKVI